MWRLSILSAAMVAAAAAAETVVPLVPPVETKAWDFARDEGRINKEFVRLTLDQITDPAVGAALDWQFQLREGAFADVFCRRTIEQPFGRIRLKVRNLGEALNLTAKLGDASGAEWTVKPVPLAAGGDWQVVELPFRDWAVASWSRDADGRLSFPVRYLALIAFGVKPGPAYRLQVAELTAVVPDPPRARVSVEGLPTTIAAGDPLEARLTLTLAEPFPADYPQPVDLTLGPDLGAGILAVAPVSWDQPPDQWTVGRPVKGAAKLSMSRWMPGGQGAWVLAGGLRLVDAQGADLAGNRLGAVTITARRPGRLRAAVKPSHGAPTIFVNDRPIPAMAYAAYGPTPEVFKGFGDAGVRLFSIMGTPTSHGYGLAVDAWVGPDQYDYRQLDERMRMVLDQCPEALIFPRIYCSAPGWWLDQHPESVVLYDPGDGQPKPFLQGGRRVPTWTSPAWRAAVDDGLRRLIAHVQSQPYADRVLGYHVVSGTTEEWMMWGANDDAWTDYSPANQEAFRAWLRARYRTDQALRAAWGDPAATLAGAAVPPRQVRAASAAGVLRNPATDTPSIDYIRFISDTTAETIGHFAATVKQATNRERLVGVFYGYLLQLFGQRQQNAAHLGFDAVVRNPDIDFLCSPTSYAFRAPGTGTSHFMAPLGSVLAHGKLWMDENDIRTSLAPGKVGDWGRPENIAGDLLQQDRELANVLVHGVGQWWFDVGQNRYDDPALMRHLQHLGEVAARTLDADRGPVDDVALVVDGRGLANVNVGDPLMADIMLQQVPTLARVGAAVGHYELHDVAALKRHRLILFAPLYDPTPDQRRAIEALQGDGRVLVFLHAPAPYRDGRWDPAGMAISGLRLKLEDTAAPVHVKLTGADPLVAGLGLLEYGPTRPTRPQVVGDDPAATVLGTLPDGRPGLLVRRYPTWTAVWSAAPNLPTALLARLAELAKAHRYATGPDVVWASRELLAISVNEAGPRTIRWPAPGRITDLYANRELAANAAQVEVDIPARGTLLLRYERR